MRVSLLAILPFGISIGIGFDADEIGQPQVVGTPAPTTDPCADAG
jgi:hypothetical protein